MTSLLPKMLLQLGLEDGRNLRLQAEAAAVNEMGLQDLGDGNQGIDGFI